MHSFTSMGVVRQIEEDQVAAGNLVVGLTRMDQPRVRSVVLAFLSALTQVQKDHFVEQEVEIVLVEVSTSQT